MPILTPMLGALQKMVVLVRRKFLSSQRDGAKANSHNTLVKLGALVVLLPLLGSLVIPFSLQGRQVHPLTAQVPPLTAQVPPLTAAVTPPRLDQVQPAFTGALSLRDGASQTLRAGKAGLIVRIDVPLCSTMRHSRVVLTVHTTRGPRQLASATVTFAHSGDPSDCAWYTFAFPHPARVTVGEVVDLTLTAPGREAALWAEDGRRGDPYPRGVGRWTGHTINDFAFRTYVRLR